MAFSRQFQVARFVTRYFVRARRKCFQREFPVEALEGRLMLSGTTDGHDHDGHDALEYHAHGTNWIDPNIPQKGHNKHTDHVTWDIDPTSDGTVSLTVLVHDHGNLDAAKLARFDAAIAEVNSASSNFGVDLQLGKVTNPSSTHQIHLHEDTTSGCGSGALGCAEYAVFINHSGKFGDGHGNHVYAGEDTSGGTAEATMISGYNWYTGADLNPIGSTQYDYQTVATQELLHLVGLDHDSTIYSSDSEVADNTDNRSVMHGTLGQKIVRRFMSTHDQELLGHVYGPGQTSDDGGNGKDKGGPPPGKGKNKVQSANHNDAPVVNEPVASAAVDQSDDDDSPIDVNDQIVPNPGDALSVLIDAPDAESRTTTANNEAEQQTSEPEVLDYKTLADFFAGFPGSEVPLL